MDKNLELLSCSTIWIVALQWVLFWWFFLGGFCTFGYLLIADMFQSEGFQTNLHWDYCSYFWICSHIFVFFYLHAADMVEVIFLTTTSELL